jgi:hypothetical protein
MRHFALMMIQSKLRITQYLLEDVGLTNIVLYILDATDGIEDTIRGPSLDTKNKYTIFDYSGLSVK